ncbi:MAG: enoyl-CoA hydratase, partial [Acidimicrobiia bacterium]|nr:enoyl-CoA hydratase [Acidimicrobiia bacterium]
AMAFAKLLANRAIDSDRQTAMWDEGYAQELISGTEDSTEGMMSFVERRPAEFKGW